MAEVHLTMPEEEYLALPHISRSHVKDWLLDPQWYIMRWIDRHPMAWRDEKQTTATYIGSRFDDLLSMEPEAYADKYSESIAEDWIEAPSWALTAKGNLKTAADAVQQLKLEYGNQRVVSPEQAAKLRQRNAEKAQAYREEDLYFRFLRERFLAHPSIGALEECIIHRQPVILWGDDLPLRARLDDYAEHDGRPIVMDTKVTSKDPDRFAGEVRRWGYDIQHVFYQDAVQAWKGVRPAFLLRVIQYVKPFKVRLLELDDCIISHARKRADEALRGILAARNGEPPKPPARCCVEAPAWMLYEESQ